MLTLHLDHLLNDLYDKVRRHFKTKISYNLTLRAKA